jgi:lipoprotein-anchoring transpeptidase ErfK/SrfK
MWKNSVFALLIAGAWTFAEPARALEPEKIEKAERDDISKNGRNAGIAKVQILLDRARFSAGAIDGRWGTNTEQAIKAFQRENELEATGSIDEKTWDKLTQAADDGVLKEYEIAKGDVEGPFVEEIPSGFKEKAELDKLAYTGPAELLAEKFHMAEEFLKLLNPDADFSKAGTKIKVARVRDKGLDGKVARIEVHKGDTSVRAFGKDGKLLAYYPATIGSEATPAPSGTFKVSRVAIEPVYTYDPKKLDFPGVDADKAFDIAPGPNNPVGMVWIDLDHEGYGLHGTPDPTKIGHTTSHGCVRMTNWDALELAEAVSKGVEVAFKEG